MNRTILFLSVFAVSFVLYGCSKGPDSKPQPPAEAASHADHADQSDMDKMRAQLAKLSPEDAASAMKQHFCPVSDEMLGVMGAPIKVDVDGQQVWICCEDCRQTLWDNPDEYLAKLNQR
jgi:hypothetical protein